MTGRGNRVGVEITGLMGIDLSMPLLDPRAGHVKAPKCDAHPDRSASHWLDAERRLLCCACFVAEGGDEARCVHHHGERLKAEDLVWGAKVGEGEG